MTKLRRRLDENLASSFTSDHDAVGAIVRQVFINPAGQRDNLGDSILRRPYLDSLRVAGELHVLLGPDEGYITGLGLRQSDRVYHSRIRWLTSAVGAAIRRQLVFAVNAGEVVGTAREAIRSLWQPALALAARLSGGVVILAGVSVQPGTSARLTHLPLLSMLAHVATWRDRTTRDQIGIGFVQPDWAFGLEGRDPGSHTERNEMAVVMRGDRPFPSDEWVAAVATLASSMDLEISVVVQVRRDAPRARELAARLGVRIVEWPTGVDHHAQEQVVRRHFGKCRIVVSDRIHALIIGFTEGAIPLGVTTSSGEKIVRTFSPVTAVPVAPGPAEAEPERWLKVIADREQLFTDLTSSRRRIAVIASRISSSGAVRTTRYGDLADDEH